MWMPSLYRDFTTRAQIDTRYGTQPWVAIHGFEDPSSPLCPWLARTRRLNG